MTSIDSSFTSLPAGTYILNNGPRKKGHGGRFTMGTHRTLRQLMKDVPGIVFTDRPEKADFVVLPEGVHEPGSKLTKRNPSLKDPRRIFSMDKISHIMRSESYHRRKHGLMYTGKDSQGREVKIDVPVNLEPSDQQFTQTIAQISTADILMIPEKDYTVIRHNIRGGTQPVIVPTPPLMQQRQQLPQQTSQQAQQTTNRLFEKIGQLDTLLGQVAPAPEIVVPQQQIPQMEQFQLQQQMPQIPQLQMQQIPQQMQQQQIPQQQMQSPTGAEATPTLVIQQPSQLAENITQAKNIYKLLVDSEPYKQNVQDFLNMFESPTFFQRARTYFGGSRSEYTDPDANYSMVYFVDLLEQLKIRFMVILHDIESRVSDIDTRREAVASTASSNIKDIQKSWDLIKKTLSDTMNKLDTMNSPTLDTDVVANHILMSIAYIFEFIKLLQTLNTKYRAYILKQLSGSDAGIHCKDKNLLCYDKNDPNTLSFVLYTLFNAACELVQSLPGGYYTETKYKTLCSKMEDNHATLADIYNYIFIQGYIQGEQKMVPMKSSGQDFCRDYYKAINNVGRALPKNITLFDILKYLQLKSLNKEQTSSVYFYFHSFLLGEDDDVDSAIQIPGRAETFSMLNTLITTKYDKATQKEIYLYMTAAMLFFSLANFCSGKVGNFSIRKIKLILNTDFTADKQVKEYDDDDEEDTDLWPL